jgi:hypothetical protein
MRMRLAGMAFFNSSAVSRSSFERPRYRRQREGSSRNASMKALFSAVFSRDESQYSGP